MTLVAVSYGNSFVVVFCWAWPRSSCCFVALETKRKSGWGICGSSLFVLLWFCVMICHFHRYRPIALCTAFFTAYVVIRTVPQSINGQTRGKKNGHLRDACTFAGVLCLVLCKIPIQRHPPPPWRLLVRAPPAVFAVGGGFWVFLFVWSLLVAFCFVFFGFLLGLT